MVSGDAIISVDNLMVYIYAYQRCNRAVDGVSFQIRNGETLCLVGESGCGKTVTASAVMQLLPELSRIEGGSITYHDVDGDTRIDQLARTGRQMRKIRGETISMIFQDPMAALNPVYPVGFQIGENLRHHTALSRREVRERVVELLSEMGIPLPEQRSREYPHQFSGGMRQRAMIAMAMACNPKVLIADEPTTALDVTIQAQIFELVDRLKSEHGTAVMLITHDMGVVTELADNVAVMYMGHIVESGSVDDVLRTPAHPYTIGLLSSIPVLGRGKNQELEPIRGTTPDSYDRPRGCQFGPRCDFRTDSCEVMPPVTNVEGTHSVRCWNAR